MELWRTALNPWGQEVLVGISWTLMWVGLGAAALFVVGHAVLARARGGQREEEAVGEPSAGDIARVPERVERHSLSARVFHWLMSLAMFGLLITAFVPVMGLQFAWVTLHWIAGLVLVAAIVWHVVHAIGWQDFWSMWMGREDLEEGIANLRAAVSSKAPPPPRAGKYPSDHKLYHHAAAVVTLVAMVTGVLMMVRIDTPLWAQNPYLLSDATWGWVYVLHGLSGVALIVLVAAHVYFAVRPEKRWITWSMIRGWIDREHYLAHHDPDKWVVSGDAKAAPPPPGGALADGAARTPRG